MTRRMPANARARTEPRDPNETDSPVTAIPTVADDTPREPPPGLPQQYQVTNGGTIMMDGVRTRIGAGKIVDERSYDLGKLRRNGIKLVKYEDEDAAPPADVAIG